jgi:uroporphyrinogen-III synthase
MRLLLTRPRHDSEALAPKLQNLGHEPICVPLIDIVARSPIELPDVNFQSVVLSSANAARAIAGHTHIDRISERPAFAVGEQSAAAARQAGFRHVEAAGGSAAALADILIDRLNPVDGAVLYLSGADIAGDLAGRMTQTGFTVMRVVLYDAIAASRLPPDTIEAIRGETLDGVLLYSPRTAAIWRDLVDSASLMPGRLIHYCLSANVAAALASSYRVAIAERPTEASLLALLGMASDRGT